MSNIVITAAEEVNIGLVNQVAGNISVAKSPTAGISIAGIVGGAGDSSFAHSQDVPSSSWTITHNLNKKPSITVVNTLDEVVYGSVQYIDSNTVTITFEQGAFSGKAYFN